MIREESPTTGPESVYVLTALKLIPYRGEVRLLTPSTTTPLTDAFDEALLKFLMLIPLNVWHSMALDPYTPMS